MNSIRFLSLTLALSACGPTLTNFCASYGDELATLEHDCIGGPTDLLKSAYEQQCTLALVGQVSHGRSTYDSAKAAACLAAIPAATCADLATPTSTVVKACRAVARGSVATGGACIFENDCSGVSYCAKPTTGECVGACAAKLAPGAACSASFECDPGAVTNRGACGTPSVCTQVPLPAHTEVALGQDCSTGDCVRGSACKRSSTGSNPTCVAFIREGSACQVGAFECEAFTACASGICKRASSLGAACSSSTADAELIGCLGDTFCDNGTCTTHKADGESCASFLDCHSFSCVNGTCGATCDESHP